MGNCHLVLSDLSQDHPLRQDIEQILNVAERAAALTRRLLAFSRQQVLQPQVMNLNAVMTNMDKLLRRLIGEDIDLVTLLDPRLGQVKADPSQLEQVIINLAVNARDAMPRGGKLTIETANVYLDAVYARQHVGVVAGPYIMLAINDTGIGMDADTRAHMFEPFFTTKEPGKGTGLGLATVYGIVQQSGGHIWLYSEPGQGTTFKIYLPQLDESADSDLSAPAALKSRRGAETILLVEDDDLIRGMARRILAKQGYTVLEASTGEHARRICAEYQGPIQLLLTDVVMPGGMSGPQLAEELESLHPEMKILFMSGYTDNTVLHYGVLEVGTAFLQKPFTPNVLSNKVRDVLDGPADEQL
jgi:CheY-like chemotaxis protein